MPLIKGGPVNYGNGNALSIALPIFSDLSWLFLGRSIADGGLNPFQIRRRSADAAKSGRGATDQKQPCAQCLRVKKGTNAPISGRGGVRCSCENDVSSERKTFWTVVSSRSRPLPTSLASLFRTIERVV